MDPTSPPDGWTGIAVVAAARPEIRVLLKRLKDARPLDRAAGSFTAGTLGGHPVLAGWTGAGSAARPGLERLLDHCRDNEKHVARLIFVGVGGGIVRGLEIGDCVVARTVADRDGEAPEPDHQWGLRATLLGARPGLVYSADHVLTTAREKIALGQEMKVRLAGTVDLESAEYARVAAERKIPYTVVSAVVDPAGEDMALDLNRFTAPDGSGLRLGPALRYGLIHPWRLPQLLKMYGELRLCSERLADIAELLVSKPKQWKKGA